MSAIFIKFKKIWKSNSLETENGRQSSSSKYHFGATVTSNGSPYATGPLSCPSCLSATLVHYGQTVGWIKMPLATEVGLGPGDIVLDGNPAASLHIKGHSSPPHVLVHFALARSPISATAELLLHGARQSVPIGLQYFTTGCPPPQNYPFARWIWTP